MQKTLVKCTGYIGDVLFASSIAKKLKEESQTNLEIHYSIPVVQPLELLYNNPYIDKVLLHNDVDQSIYDSVINIPLVDQSITPPRQFQQAAGVNNIDDEFKVYTNPAFDYAAEQAFKETKPPSLSDPRVC